MKDVEAYGEEYVSGAVAGNELLSCLKLILKQGKLCVIGYCVSFTELSNR